MTFVREILGPDSAPRDCRHVSRSPVFESAEVFLAIDAGMRRSQDARASLNPVGG